MTIQRFVESGNLHHNLKPVIGWLRLAEHDNMGISARHASAIITKVESVQTVVSNLDGVDTTLATYLGTLSALVNQYADGIPAEKVFTVLVASQLVVDHYDIIYRAEVYLPR